MVFPYWLIWARLMDDKLDHLIEYETSLPRRSDMKAKGFCLYNEDDFNCGFLAYKRKAIRTSWQGIIDNTTPKVK